MVNLSILYINNMEEYKIETIFAALIGGIGILWHQLIKQIGINRADQKEFSSMMVRNIEALAEFNLLMDDLRKLIKDGQDK